MWSTGFRCAGGFAVIWAVTSYFNPLGFDRRYLNFAAFRRELDLPLLTVEWSPESRFELEEGDSDILLRLSGGSLMWQKERMLNIAISALPSDCDAVAWLDCDVIFDAPDWISNLRSALEESAVVQLFTEVVHESPASTHTPLLTRESLVSLVQRAGSEKLVECMRGSAPARATDGLTEAQLETRELERLFKRPTSGHAWAARRELLDEHGLYDACVCGSGDMAIGLAAMGLQTTFSKSFPLSSAQEAHYHSWAEPLARATGGRAGVLSSKIRHLFHGSLSNRQYRSRLEWLSRSGFDPGRDLVTDEHGLWQWAHESADREAWFRDYFARRSEDHDVCAVADLGAGRR